jgi:hypothetical protein
MLLQQNNTFVSYFTKLLYSFQCSGTSFRIKPFKWINQNHRCVFNDFDRTNIKFSSIWRRFCLLLYNFNSEVLITYGEWYIIIFISNLIYILSKPLETHLWFWNFIWAIFFQKDIPGVLNIHYNYSLFSNTRSDLQP